MQFGEDPSEVAVQQGRHAQTQSRKPAALKNAIRVRRDAHVSFRLQREPVYLLVIDAPHNIFGDAVARR